MKLSRFFSVLSLCIFFLIVIGGLVRNLGAGLSCPDWPLCQGRIIPQFDLRVFAEYFHRLFAALVSCLTLGLALFVFAKKDLRRSLGGPMALALGLLVTQVILGGLTVLKLLQSEIVTLHLATGTLFFATVLVMALKTRGASQSKSQPSSLLRWALVVLGAVYLQIILGGIVSSHYAGLACPDFPTCKGSWWPDSGSDANVHIQWAHRLGATIVFISTLAFGLKALKNNQLRGLAVGVLFLLFLQVALGVANVWLRLPVPLSVAHLAIAESLFALVLLSTYEIRRLKLR